MIRKAVVRSIREIRFLDLEGPVLNAQRHVFINWLRDQVAMIHIRGCDPDWSVVLSEIWWVRSAWPGSLLAWTPPGGVQAWGRWYVDESEDQ